MIRAALPAFVLLGAGLASPATPVAAQGVRGEARLFASWLDYRTVFRDSMPEDQVPGSGTTRVLPDGTVVTCLTGGDCYWYRGGDMRNAGTYTQDLRLTAWPGLTGVHGQVHVRSRLGSDSFWPRSGERVEILRAFVDVERAGFRLRAGRQDHGGGLGVYSFDGAALLWKQVPWFRVEGWVGRSLARVLRQPRTGDLLAEAEPVPPDRGSSLWGLEGTFLAGRTFSGALLYQRELLSDRSGLYSERLAADARLRTRPVTVEAGLDVDVAFAEVNEARVQVRYPFGPGLTLHGGYRYYQPFLELWTIWGAFSPVGYNEGRAGVTWQARADLDFEASGAFRDYEETFAGAEAFGLQEDGWRSRVGGNWRPGAWDLSLHYGFDTGFGAVRQRVDAAAGRWFNPRTYAGAFFTGTQQGLEYRFGEGRSGGAGAEVSLRFGTFTVDGSAAWYRHAFEDRPGFDDYDQFRGRLGLRYEFGTPVAARPTPPREGRS